MNCFRLVCLWIALAGVSGLCLAADPGQAALQGKWQAIEASSNGEAPPAGMLEKITLVFNGETVSIMGAPPTRFRTDSTLQPAHIDFMNSHHQVGIYMLSGDTLKLCTGQEGDRPTEFSTKQNTDQTYLLLKRVKE